MTDIANRPLSDAQLDAIAALDVNLADDSSIDEAAALRRIAAAELSAMKSAQAEDFAQFTVETTRRRADRFANAFKASLMDHLTARVPKKLRNSVEALADVLVDEIAAGTEYDELDVAGHIESWMEER
jgi:predicted TPR repeat methyltransferase